MAPKLSDQQKFQILGLEEAQWSNRRIATHYGTTESTVRRLLRKYAETGSVKNRHGQGRKRKTTHDADQQIVCAFRTNPFGNTMQPALLHGITQQTVRNRLKEANLECRRPYVGCSLTENHRRLRMEWALDRSPNMDAGRWCFLVDTELTEKIVKTRKCDFQSVAYTYNHIFNNSCLKLTIFGTQLDDRCVNHGRNGFVRKAQTIC